MARRLLLTLFLPTLTWAAVWPAEFAGWQRVSSAPVDVAVRPLWDEYGLAEAESARYASKGRAFEAIAWRMGDSTGAFGAFQWQRPAGALPVTLGQAAVSSPTETLVVEGNYLLSFRRFRPEAGQLKALASALPRMRRTLLPVVAGFLPSKGLVGGSERYLLGPLALQEFFAGIPVSAAGFDFSGEAQTGAYRIGAGEARLAVFYYPTPAIARQQVAAFEKLPGVYAKRSGPLVAAVVPPASAEQARELLDRVQYEANVTWNERTPIRRDNVGELVVSAFVLAGILLLVCVGGGLAVGGLRVFSTRRGHAEITVLHIPR